MKPLKSSPQISLVIPLHNEVACLEKNLTQVETYLAGTGNSYEVILVDDGSQDGTYAVCTHMARHSETVRLISYDTNRGKGYAVRTGVMNATGDYVIFTDADLAVPIHFVGPCLTALQSGAPVVIASRHLAKSAFRIREGICRRFLGEIFRQLAKTALGLSVSDITCGFKGFTQGAGIDIFSRSRINRWGYDAEVLFLAQHLGYTVTEIPVDWYHSFDSKVHVAIDSFRSLWEICQIRWNACAGIYEGRRDLRRRPAGAGHGR
jgi:glycosyltransferase involved in cell wall biosynthesis